MEAGGGAGDGRKQEEEGEGGGEGGVGAGRDGDEETAGWLMWVRAREGRAVERPRRVWAVLKAGTLTLYEDHISPYLCWRC